MSPTTALSPTAPAVPAPATGAATTRRSIAGLAVRDFAPLAAALIPFSLAIGAAAAAHGLSLPEAAFGAVALLAGTAQLAATELIGANAHPAVVVITVMLINARFVIYGAGVVRWFPAVPLRRRLVLAFPLVDQSFLCCEHRFTSIHLQVDRRRYYWVGTAMLMSVFLTSELIGYAVGPALPPWLGLHLAAPLAFVGMLVQAIKNRGQGAAAMAAAVAVVAGSALPAGVELPLAIAVGFWAGSSVTRSEP